MAYQPYSDEGLAVLLVLLTRVEDPAAHAPFPTFQDQLNGFANLYAAATPAQQQNHEFLVKWSKMNQAYADPEVKPLIDDAHTHIVTLMNKLVDKQLWSVCGAIKRDKVLELAGL